MTKVGHNVIQRQLIEQNPGNKQKSQTVYVTNNGKICMYHLNTKEIRILFFSSLNKLFFGLSLFVNYPCTTLPTITTNNREFTIVTIFSFTYRGG
jgi:hypothetical protein